MIKSINNEQITTNKKYLKIFKKGIDNLKDILYNTDINKERIQKSDRWGGETNENLSNQRTQY